MTSIPGFPIPLLLVCVAPWVGCRQPSESAAPPSASAKSTTAGATSRESTEWTAALEVLRKEQPEEYERERSKMTVFFKLALARFGYLEGPFDEVLDSGTVKAIRAYEAARGITVTGNPLNFETFRRWSEDYEALDARPLLMPQRNVHVEAWDKGWVWGDGTWTIPHGNIAFPEQTTHLDCDRTRMTCTEATATVSKGSLSVFVQTYNIERWDDAEIVTKASQGGCARHILRVNRLTRGVTGFRTKVRSGGLCSSLDNADVHSELADGFEVWQKLRDEQNARVKKIMRLSDGARRVLDESRR